MGITNKERKVEPTEDYSRNRDTRGGMHLSEEEKEPRNDGRGDETNTKGKHDLQTIVHSIIDFILCFMYCSY